MFPFDRAFFSLPLGSFSFSFPSSFHGGLVLLVLELMALCCLFSHLRQGLRAVILSVFVLCRACCLTFSARAFVVLPDLYFVCLLSSLWAAASTCHSLSACITGFALLCLFPIHLFIVGYDNSPLCLYAGALPLCPAVAVLFCHFLTSDI